MFICTDVAARGLDFPAVTSIVQADVPGAPSEYVHRVGRTARMGQAGDAVLLLLPSERPYIDLLHHKGVLLQQEQLAPILRDLQREAGSDKGRKPMPDVEMWAAMMQKNLCNIVAGQPKLAQLAGDAFRSFVRSYTTHSGDVKQIFHVRRLHLGHIAFSFCLQQNPGLVGSSGSSLLRKRKKAEERKKMALSSSKKQKRMMQRREG